MSTARGRLGEDELSLLRLAAERTVWSDGRRAWRLEIKPDRIIVKVDCRQRWRSDPQGRIGILTAGMVTLSLRAGVGWLGFRPLVLLHDPARSNHIATVICGPRGSQPAPEAALFPALLRTGQPARPAEGVLAVRKAAVRTASRYDSWLYPVGRADERRHLLDLLGPGDDQRPASVSAWTAITPPGQEEPRPSGHGRRSRTDAGGYTWLAVLGTIGDRPVDWLHAGQALQAVLLTAAGLGVTGAPDDRIRSTPSWRSDLITELALPGQPQALLRMTIPLPSGADSEEQRAASPALAGLPHGFPS